MANTPEKKQKQYSRRTSAPLKPPVPNQSVLNPVPRDKIRVVNLPKGAVVTPWCAVDEEAPLATVDKIKSWLQTIIENSALPIKGAAGPSLEMPGQQLVAQIPSSQAVPKPATSKQRGIPYALRIFSDLPAEAFVRQDVVEALFACSGATVWRHIQKHLIPKSKKLSSRITAWQVGELREALTRKHEGENNV